MTENSTERQQLADGMASMGLDAKERVVGQLLEYMSQLRKWNRTYNLVSSGDLPHMVPRHVLDSLSVHSHLLSGRLLDVGTGAGFPGLPLAIVRPDIQATLLDSTGKKIRFLNHIKRSMDLNNIFPEASRVGEFNSEEKFDVIISRAFSSLLDFANSVRHLVAAETRLLAMKGKRPDKELKVLPGWLNLSSVVQLQVPGLHAERHLVIMSVAS